LGSSWGITRNPPSKAWGGFNTPEGEFEREGERKLEKEEKFLVVRGTNSRVRPLRINYSLAIPFYASQLGL